MREEGYGREWPERVGMDEAIVKKVDEKWGSLGLF
jgi:3-polyprenyl-4-hydroxybenzoate decarboxylase